MQFTTFHHVTGQKLTRGHSIKKMIKYGFSLGGGTFFSLHGEITIKFYFLLENHHKLNQNIQLKFTKLVGFRWPEKICKSEKLKGGVTIILKNNKSPNFRIIG